MRRKIVTPALTLLHVLVWAGAAFSLGWYYTFTYYGRSGWPMPLMETSGALVAYYFTVLNVETEIQAVHWMVVFPLAALLWAASLRITARWTRVGALSWPHLLIATAIAAVPLALPGPWMAWLAATKYEGFDWDTMTKIALRRDNYSPWPWLSPAYFALGLAGLVLELALLVRWCAAARRKVIIHYLVAACVYTVAISTLAALMAWPLRAWLEARV